MKIEPRFHALPPETDRPDTNAQTGAQADLWADLPGNASPAIEPPPSAGHRPRAPSAAIADDQAVAASDRTPAAEPAAAAEPARVPEPASAPKSAPASEPASEVASRHALRPGQRPTIRFMLSHPFHLPSLGFGSGLSPVVPGTCGTLFGWLSFVVLNHWLSTAAWLVVIVVGFIAGIGLCGFTADRMRTSDPGAVVWDEIVAIWLVLLVAAPEGFLPQLGAFAVFRFFDMVKPPPIRYFDQRLKGGFGIMFDDLVAAFFALIVLALWHRFVG